MPPWYTYTKDIDVCPGSFPCIGCMPPFDDFHRGWLERKNEHAARPYAIKGSCNAGMVPLQRRLLTRMGRTVGLLGSTIC